MDSGEGMKATGSYLENQTSDTLYRVTVTYAIPARTSTTSMQ